MAPETLPSPNPVETEDEGGLWTDSGALRGSRGGTRRALRLRDKPEQRPECGEYERDDTPAVSTQTTASRSTPRLSPSISWRIPRTCPESGRGPASPLPTHFPGPSRIWAPNPSPSPGLAHPVPGSRWPLFLNPRPGARPTPGGPRPCPLACASPARFRTVPAPSTPRAPPLPPRRAVTRAQGPAPARARACSVHLWGLRGYPLAILALIHLPRPALGRRGGGEGRGVQGS